MPLLLAVATGVLFAAALFLMLRRSIVNLAIGLGLLSHSMNLLIFTAAGVTRARPPIVPEDAAVLAPPFADPLPQALILTAIVISFGVTAFLVVLIQRASKAVGSDDLDAMKATDA